jgi:tetratricopeptide (TPR) repeat protein
MHQVSDCSAAITLKDDYAKAYSRRAQAYSELEQFEDCVRDYEKFQELDPETGVPWIRSKRMCARA